MPSEARGRGGRTQLRDRPGQPAVIFGRDIVVTDPTPDKVARLLGLNYNLIDDEAFDVLIVGGGPAGVAAGVYAGAEGLRALVVEDVGDRRPGRHIEPDRELHGISDRHLRAPTSSGAARSRR